MAFVIRACFVPKVNDDSEFPSSRNISAFACDTPEQLRQGTYRTGGEVIHAPRSVSGVYSAIRSFMKRHPSASTLAEAIPRYNQQVRNLMPETTIVDSY